MTDTVPIRPPEVAAAPPDWPDQALCAQADPEAWFPEQGEAAKLAKAICGTCPVQAPCLAYAFARPELRGIWGGLSERERRAIRRGSGMSDTIPQPARDALAAVLEALDIPNAATVGDDETRAAILDDRIVHAVIMLRNILGEGDDIAWQVAYLRERLAEHPATGYKTWDEAKAELAAANARRRHPARQRRWTASCGSARAAERI